MKKYILLLTLSFAFAFAYGQNGKFIQFKLYKNVDFGFGQLAGSRTIELGVFSPAIAWGKDDNFHEIQLLSVNFFSRSAARNYSAGAEYSYNYRISDEGSGKFQFYFGGGIGGSFRSNYSEIFRGGAEPFATSGKAIRVNLVALPRLTYEIRNNILLDFSLPYHFAQFENLTSNEQDPSIPVNQQTNNVSDFTVLPRSIAFKVGAIVRF